MSKWRDTGIRALKTGLQAALAILTAAGTGYVHISSLRAAGIAGGAAVLSFLQNAVSTAELPPAPKP